ncbi:hypothetical protein NPIL_520491, partial [Nephila pilipes]
RINPLLRGLPLYSKFIPRSSGVKLVRATDLRENELEDAEVTTEPVEMADVSDRTPDDFPSQSDPLNHCRNLQTNVQEYAQTLKGISEVEGQSIHAQLFPFSYGAQDLEGL